MQHVLTDMPRQMLRIRAPRSSSRRRGMRLWRPWRRWIFHEQLIGMAGSQTITSTGHTRRTENVGIQGLRNTASHARTAAALFLAAQRLLDTGRPHEAHKYLKRRVDTQSWRMLLGIQRDSREGAAWPAQNSISQAGRRLAWATKLGGSELRAWYETQQTVLSVYNSKILLPL